MMTCLPVLSLLPVRYALHKLKGMDQFSVAISSMASPALFFDTYHCCLHLNPPVHLLLQKKVSPLVFTQHG